MVNTHRAGVIRPGYRYPKLVAAGSKTFCIQATGLHSQRYGYHAYVIEEIDNPGTDSPWWTKHKEKEPA